MPTELEAAAVLLAIVPGYLTMFFWSRNKTWRGMPQDLHLILPSLSLSLVIQALLLPWTLGDLYPVRAHLSDFPLDVAAWLLVAFLIGPYILGTASARIGERLSPPTDVTQGGKLRQVWRWLYWPSASPNLWDWATTSGTLDACYVVITFADGRQIAGSYGPPGISLTSPESPGIYLSTEWVLNEKGDFDVAVANSQGILVPIGPDVRSVRLLRGETPDERQTRTQADSSDARKEGSISSDGESGLAASPASSANQQPQGQQVTAQRREPAPRIRPDEPEKRGRIPATTPPLPHPPAPAVPVPPAPRQP